MWKNLWIWDKNEFLTPCREALFLPYNEILHPRLHALPNESPLKLPIVHGFSVIASISSQRDYAIQKPSEVIIILPKIRSGHVGASRTQTGM